MAVSIWYKGFSRQSDNDGLVRVKLVDDFLRTESEAVKRKTPQRFMSEPAYRAVRKWGNGKVPRLVVKEKAERNLSNRNWVIPGMGWMMDAFAFTVVPGVPATDFNSSPEQQAKAVNVWSSDILAETHPQVLDGTITMGWSTDWDPSTGTPEWWLEKVKERVAQIKAAPGGPTGFEPR